MKSAISACTVMLAIAFLSHSAVAFSFSGRNCNILSSVAGLVNKTDLQVCDGIILPQGVAVASYGSANDLAEIRLDVYQCTFNFRSAVGISVTDNALVAHAGLGLNNSQCTNSNF